MAIKDLQNLRDRWIDHSDLNAKVEYVQQIVDQQLILPERVHCAAQLGDVVASQFYPANTHDRRELRESVTWATSYLTPKESVHFALMCTSRVVSAWQTMYPSDLRPIQALDEVRNWIHGTSTKERLAQSASDAEAASLEKDDGFMPDREPARAMAINAADAAWHTAYAAAICADSNFGNEQQKQHEFSRAIGYIASFARHGFADLDSGKEWILQRLCDYLLGLVNTLDVR